MMNAAVALYCVKAFLGLSILTKSFELSLLLPRSRKFGALLFIQTVLSLILIFSNSNWIPVLLFFTMLITNRALKVFYSGGSDVMDQITAAGLAVIGLSSYLTQNPILLYRVLSTVLIYLAAQLILSYFIAGLAKIRNPLWRKGYALRQILAGNQNYQIPEILSSHVPNLRYSQIFSYLIIAFELSFPLVILNADLRAIYIALAVIFHLLNFYVLGLNRFVWSWLPLYPALLFLPVVSLF